MDFAPNVTTRLARARTDLRVGQPVAVVDEAGKPSLVFAVETLAGDHLADLQDQPEAQLALTAHRAETLKLRAYDGDMARVRLPRDLGLEQVMALADPSLDLRHPMKGPFPSIRDDAASVARAGIALAKSAHLLPAVVAVPAGTLDASVTRLHVSDIPTGLGDAPHLLQVAGARVPLAVSDAGRCLVFRPETGGEEHYAVEIGRPERAAPVLVRLHSACFTGDVIGSQKCDCGPQLHAALHQMGEEGTGVLLYLNQEGRGIGLANKMRAYALQDQGFDTVEANHRLGFEDDERDFRIGAAILKEMGIRTVRLLTNNPAKIAMMEGQGITVAERVPLHAGETPQNRDYLATKAAKSGHLR
ncbi:GTP cyclohydrolase II [Pseudaestuariivita atlantica]|uniref:GTP cyclohydrolase-2 n=1 Tax=Pseudaestuariivita atlantica TaxID=1317121 RepID=A0A0L1JP18_9RHOB|nr:GTP cyclohydrolase II [Pseudaestuariivita atlantica]KNG93504.1 GTP cyclohydrolase [Pseudaestuariivita atlantica]